MDHLLNHLIILNQNSKNIIHDQTHSEELQKAATNVRNCIKPCFQQIQESANTLKQLTQSGLYQLAEAEESWESKPKFAALDNTKIVEEVGKLSGQRFKIYQLYKEARQDIVKEYQKISFNRYEVLKQEYSIQDKEKSFVLINPKNIERIKKDLLNIIEKHNKFVFDTLQKKLDGIYTELHKMDYVLLSKYMEGFPVYKRYKYSDKMNNYLSESNKLFNNFSQNLQVIYFNNQIDKIIEDFKNQDNLRCKIGKLDDFWEKYTQKQEEFIENILDERWQFIKKVYQEAIDVYNIMLDYKNRYQQETSEQREAEKNWIDEQRQQFQAIQQKLDVVLQYLD